MRCPRMQFLSAEEPSLNDKKDIERSNTSCMMYMQITLREIGAFSRKTGKNLQGSAVFSL